jgi:hypothetical protein
VTTATRTPFVVERVDLREPDIYEKWEFETVEEAAARFESEITAQNWPYEQILEELQAEGYLSFPDFDLGFSVSVERRDVAGWVR